MQITTTVKIMENIKVIIEFTKININNTAIRCRGKSPSVCTAGDSRRDERYTGEKFSVINYFRKQVLHG